MSTTQTAQGIMSVAQNVKNLRTKKGWTQTDLAQAAGVSYPRISEIERSCGNPTLQTLAAVADALGVKLEALVRKPKERSPAA